MLSVLSSGTSGSLGGSSTGVATASGWIALLQEEDVSLRKLALEQLLQCVHVQWSEVAEALPELEALADAKTPEVSPLAAAVASRVFFHLQEPTQALRLALEAGPAHFDPMKTTDSSSAAADAYAERLVAAALDAYVAASSTTQAGEDATMTDADVDADKAIPKAQLQAMIDRLLERSCQAGQHAHALGMALEAKQVDKVQSILEHAAAHTTATQLLELLQHAIHLATSVVTSKAFRNETLQLVATRLQEQQQENAAVRGEEAALTAPPLLLWVYQLLHQPKEAAQVLTRLLSVTGREDDATLATPASLLGLQMCFDLMDSGDQAFVTAVATAMPKGDEEEDDGNLSESAKVRLAQAQRILVGGFSAELAVSFLHKHSQADRLILELLKKSMEERSSGASRNSVLHNAAVVTHAYLYAGTTNDSFLRDYLDWMKKASNWAKFSATASLGVIHAAHITEARHLLQPYLPKLPEAGGAAEAVSPTGGYAEGGSLYALGLVHGAHAGSSATARQETCDWIRQHLRVSHANEVQSHGAALGVGLTALGTANVAVVQELKQLLDTDSAVAGEAAGIAMGMVLCGTGAGNATHNLPLASAAAIEEVTDVVAELKNYARVTQHEKIIRGIGMGLALMNFGQEENADACIEEMRADRDPVMRYGAQYCLALAYCGTGSNKAIRILLHTAVSDVSDDVRMAAVLGLAFVLYPTPERVPELVKLLLESFNPHVRYASCMAVGIAMAGTGDAESIAMLEPMLEDMTDYVRQGALMGTALIYMQQNNNNTAGSDSAGRGKLRAFREKLAAIVTEKHQSMLTKMGAILSTGLLDAGGRNCTLSLRSRHGFVKMSSAVGLALWLQHWHWFPMMHMLSLALTPTLTIGLNQDLKYPKAQAFEIVCHAKPSQFAYPKKLEEKKEEKKKRVETVTLSTTAKEKARLARKRAKEGGGAEALAPTKEAAEAKPSETTEKTEDGTSMEVEAGSGEKKDDEAKEVVAKEEGDTTKEAAVPKKKKTKTPEPTSFRIGNPSRITAAQSQVCEFDLSQRYRPIRPHERPYGVIVLTDTAPQEEEDVGAVMAPSLEPEGELPPPEPFEWMAPDTPPPAPTPQNDDKEESKLDDNDGDNKKEDAASSDDVKPMEE